MKARQDCPNDWTFSFQYYWTLMRVIDVYVSLRYLCFSMDSLTKPPFVLFPLIICSSKEIDVTATKWTNWFP